jgi:hypothetical protein
MGEKEVVDLAGLNGKLVEGEFWITTICLAAVHKDIYAVG